MPCGGSQACHNEQSSRRNTLNALYIGHALLIKHSEWKMGWWRNAEKTRYNEALRSLCACMCAKSLQSCPTLCDPMDCILPGSSVHVILQARILEWHLGAYHLSKNVLGPARILSGGKHAPCPSLPAL